MSDTRLSRSLSLPASRYTSEALAAAKRWKDEQNMRKEEELQDKAIAVLLKSLGTSAESDQNPPEKDCGSEGKENGQSGFVLKRRATVGGVQRPQRKAKVPALSFQADAPENNGSNFAAPPAPKATSVHQWQVASTKQEDYGSKKGRSYDRIQRLQRKTPSPSLFRRHSQNTLQECPSPRSASLMSPRSPVAMMVLKNRKLLATEPDFTQ